MKIKDLPNLDKPTLYHIELDDIQSFISLYREFIESDQFTVLPADGGTPMVGFIAYYEQDSKEYGYNVRISMGKASFFLQDKNNELEENRKWWNIHHYVGADNPIQRIAEQHLKETDIALGKIKILRERYPELKDYIDGELQKILV